MSEPREQEQTYNQSFFPQSCSIASSSDPDPPPLPLPPRCPNAIHTPFSPTLVTTPSSVLSDPDPAPAPAPLPLSLAGFLPVISFTLTTSPTRIPCACPAAPVPSSPASLSFPDFPEPELAESEMNSPTTRPPIPVLHCERTTPVSARPVACRVRRVAGDTDAAVVARVEEETSAACSVASRSSCVVAKRPMGVFIVLGFVASCSL